MLAQILYAVHGRVPVFIVWVFLVEFVALGAFAARFANWYQYLRLGWAADRRAKEEAVRGPLSSKIEELQQQVKDLQAALVDQGKRAAQEQVKLAWMFYLLGAATSIPIGIFVNHIS
ncbi:hypothetical protein [Nonomuraea endophytica]|uniref:Uncharacterized protein n=1 Tax=Nonomuraea endophytica TaxID=714136 RepID=A0A7W8AFC1_9ACTN|nr:hypothetical protein [Nonomuraea endophytica]MBB5085124.1 hypothetical protein [Nonomuraea endophytica]